MQSQLIITAEIINAKGERQTVHKLLEKEIETPEDISQFGLNKEEQLHLLKEAQQFVLEKQTDLFSACPHTSCPKCGHKIWRNGGTPALFHGFYSEHQLKPNQWRCSVCPWFYTPRISSYFGSNISPELMKAQAQLGATMPYRKGANNLKLLTGDRKIHNHTRLRETTQQIAKRVEDTLDHAEKEKASEAKELLVNVDGAYIHDATNKRHNFEAMVAKIYQPENVKRQDKSHCIITEKQCVGSAQKDNQATMKKNLVVAARREGMCANTVVTGLADGAKNCWNVIKSLSAHCFVLICILDWFHIGKYFNNVEKQLPKKEKRLLDIAKESLWNGHANACLFWLDKIKNRLSQTKQLDKLNALIVYIKSNKDYILNYAKRKDQGQPYSSHVAESTVEHYASARLKKKQKMQWTRNGAHGILQHEEL